MHQPLIMKCESVGMMMKSKDVLQSCRQQAYLQGVFSALWKCSTRAHYLNLCKLLDVMVKDDPICQEWALNSIRNAIDSHFLSAIEGLCVLLEHRFFAECLAKEASLLCTKLCHAFDILESNPFDGANANLLLKLTTSLIDSENFPNCLLEAHHCKLQERIIHVLLMHDGSLEMYIKAAICLVKLQHIITPEFDWDALLAKDSMSRNGMIALVSTLLNTSESMSNVLVNW